MQIIANGLQIEVDIQGPEHGEPILLIMGLGMQLIGWPDELVQMLVQRGFRVIRHDNRDVGLSQGFDRHGVPNVMVEALRHRCGCACARPTRWPTWRPTRWACSTRWASSMRTSAAHRWVA